MEEQENRAKYSATNAYLTLNRRSKLTRNVWMVFHGIGYLSRYFIKYFKVLNAEENYVIAPQAPSKYYLNNEYKHVGASWLTREDTQSEMENIHNYLNAVFSAESLDGGCPLTVLGFSQGVSVAMRWVARNKISCQQLILYAGGIPEELKAGDFDFLSGDTKIVMLTGDQDGYMNSERLEKERNKARELFGQQVEFLIFNGKHEIKPELLTRFTL